MITVHLASNGKTAAIAKDNILFIQEYEEEDTDHKKIEFTRIFLKEKIIEDESGKFIDVNDSVATLVRKMKA